MDSLEELIHYLSSTKFLNSKTVKKALLKIDRKCFVPLKYKCAAYSDVPLHIGFNQTISAPSVVSFMLEKLQLKKGMNVLEIGSGSGYNTALIAEIVGTKGKVVSIDRIPELTEFAKSNITKCTKYSNIEFFVGDGTKGYLMGAPYDRIIATGSLPSLKKSHPLIKQLKKDGILIAPVGELYWQNLLLYKKEYNSFEKILPVLFVPLLGEHGFEESEQG